MANNSARAIITSEEMISKNECHDISKTDSSFYFLFGRDSDPESDPQGGGNYAYFLMEMKSGLAQLEEASNGIVYLEKGEMFQKLFHVSSEKSEEKVLYGFVIPLTEQYDYPFTSMRALY